MAPYWQDFHGRSGEEGPRVEEGMILSLFLSSWNRQVGLFSVKLALHLPGL